MKTVLAMALILIILGSPPLFGAGGLEVEVGDVQGAGVRPDHQNKAKQEETEKARLKAVDEKLRKAEEEGSRPTAEGSGTKSSVPTPTNTGDARP